MTEQSQQGAKSEQHDAAWESFEVAGAWRSSGLAQRLREQLFDPYVEDHVRKQRCIIERPLSAAECTAAAIELQQHSDLFHKIGKRFIKFVALGLSGVVTAAKAEPKEKIIFVEFGAREEGGARLGLPSALQRIKEFTNQPAPLEVFSQPVGIVIRSQSESSESNIDLLYSAGAYEAARKHLDMAATEIEIWRSGSPFAVFEQLTERSALLANILTHIEAQQRKLDQGAFVLAIEHLGFLGQDQIELGVYVGRADRRTLLQSPASLQIQLHEYRIESDRSVSGTLEIECQQMWSEKAENLSSESMRRAAHIWLLKYKRLANAYGVAQTAEAFSWQKREDDERRQLKQLFGT